MTADFTSLWRDALIGKLEELHNEVRQLVEPLSDEELWIKPINPSNSIGHLFLHLTGNLNHFVGARLGGTGYVRDREREFTETQPPSRTTLYKGLEDAVATFRRVVSGLSAEQFAAPFPDPKFGNTAKALVHLVTHFALHRGQISYLVRLVKKT